MILVDTSIWIDHLRSADAVLTRLLEEGKVLMHPFVVGELAVGDLRPRAGILRFLQMLPKAKVARDQEVLSFIEQAKLFGLGLGYVDVHLLASVRLTPNTALWTRDKQLTGAATRLTLNAKLLH